MMNNCTQEILKVIAIHYPYHINEIERVYKRFKSIDKTIELIETCTSHGMNIDGLLDAIKSTLIKL